MSNVNNRKVNGEFSKICPLLTMSHLDFQNDLNKVLFFGQGFYKNSKISYENCLSNKM